MNESKYMYMNLGRLEEYSQSYAALHAKEDYYCYCNLSQIPTKDGNDNNKLRTVKEAYTTALRKNSSKNFYDFPHGTPQNNSPLPRYLVGMFQNDRQHQRAGRSGSM